MQSAYLLIASTFSVYGANTKVLFSETDRTDQPLSLYAAAKKGTEVMAHSYAHLFGIPTAVLRFFTVYGPWGRPEMALFKFVKGISNGAPINVFGHGDMARDFTFIEDVVESVTRLVPLAPVKGDPQCAEPTKDSLSDEAPYRTVNIACGAPVRLMELISVVERSLGRKVQVNFLDMQPGDVPQTFGDARLLNAFTDYRPKVKVEAGVAAFVDWYREFYG